MESLKTISKLEIPTSKILYDKDSKRLAIEILGFTYIGHYKSSTRISEILDDFYKSLGSIELQRSDLSIVDAITSSTIPEIKKIKEISFGIEKKATEITDAKKHIELEPAEAKEDKGLERKQLKDVTSALDMLRAGKPEEKKAKKRETVSKPAAPPPPPKSAPAGPAAGAAAPVKKEKEVYYAEEKPKAEDYEVLSRDLEEESLDDELALVPSTSEEGRKRISEVTKAPQLITYDINMGLQYYSIMMERQSYLFYVYFSHQELVIEDEEGKVVYKTKFTITTTKKEPPVLDLRIEGEGFEVHPLSGKVEVKKEFVNPPVMIFSVLPTKLKKRGPKKQDKKGERRFLHVYIDFEDKNVSHTILTISVQPKFYRLDLGPFHINLSKNQALIVSFVSILITIISLAYTLVTLEPDATLVDILSGAAPGIGSLIFVATFIVTLITKGVFPIKEQVSALLNFDQGPTFIK
ncbi:MAG: hypothetical protein ACFFAO_09465 [Candidatus Hermodarchaeota archaeon]